MTMCVDPTTGARRFDGARSRRTVESHAHDGVELARVRRRPRGLPVREAGLLLLAIVAFKVFLYIDLGGASYGAKVESLRQGGTFERTAARVMALDPVSRIIVDALRFRAL